MIYVIILYDFTYYLLKILRQKQLAKVMFVFLIWFQVQLMFKLNMEI